MERFTSLKPVVNNFLAKHFLCEQSEGTNVGNPMARRFPGVCCFDMIQAHQNGVITHPNWSTEACPVLGFSLSTEPPATIHYICSIGGLTWDPLELLDYLAASSWDLSQGGISSSLVITECEVGPLGEVWPGGAWKHRSHWSSAWTGTEHRSQPLPSSCWQ